jgi:hypothetical protein
MPKVPVRIILIFLLSCISIQVIAWGFFGHRQINRMAVFGLPASMIGYYKKHIAYITNHAIDPDKRRYTNTTEAAKHYIDCDHYGLHPFDSIPKTWKSAVIKYTEDTLRAYGIVPWQIELTTRRLSNAFKNGNSDLILHYSADLGHYVADAHVPLHTTENYNGQLTNQLGIHGFWESRLPELFSGSYNFFAGKAVYIEEPIAAAWSAVQASYAAKDSVLQFEAALNARFPADRKYELVTKNKKTIKVYSQEYATAYDKALNGMVERRMRAAIALVSSLWYTAWVNAGQPDLSRLAIKSISDSLKKAHAAEEKVWKERPNSKTAEHDQ